MKKIKIAVLSLIVILLNISAYGQSTPKKALLVIDIQENLINPNSKIHMDTTGLDNFFANLNHAITEFNNQNSMVIYVVNEWTNPVKNMVTGNVCKKGGQGVGPDKRMILVNDCIYVKSKPNALSNSDLLNYLRENSISEVMVCGLLAEGCVKATVKGLINEKFQVTVIENVLGSKNETKKQKVLQYLQHNKIKTIQSEAL